MPSSVSVEKAAEADFPTEYGHFRIFGFQAGSEEAVAVVMGAEATGISPFWVEKADQRIIIPMQGKVDSMNVAASTATIIQTDSRWKEGWNDPRIIPEEVLNPADVPTGSPLLNRITAISKEGIRTITPAVTGK